MLKIYLLKMGNFESLEIDICVIKGKKSDGHTNNGKYRVTALFIMLPKKKQNIILKPRCKYTIFDIYIHANVFKSY